MTTATVVKKNTKIGVSASNCTFTGLRSKCRQDWKLWGDTLFRYPYHCPMAVKFLDLSTPSTFKVYRCLLCLVVFSPTWFPDSHQSQDPQSLLQDSCFLIQSHTQEHRNKVCMVRDIIQPTIVNIRPNTRAMPSLSKYKAMPPLVGRWSTYVSPVVLTE